MNCKPGDLAVVVKGFPEANIGKVVRCIGLDPVGEILFGIPCWRTDDAMSYDDLCLRPIRDNDGEDETLTWAGKPSEVTA